MSLLCGLPNEQELALNVCTILSNEGNYMLHLEQNPKLVDLLIAQVGIWPKGLCFSFSYHDNNTEFSYCSI